MNSAKDHDNVLQSVQNGLKIIKLFSLSKPVWGITEIANTLQLSKSTVSRLINDLVKEEFLIKTKNKYRLGISLLCLSGVITSHLDIYKESKEPLKNLVNKFDEASHLAILEDSNVTYLHKFECSSPDELVSSVGKKSPASCSSSGKILLAYQTEKIIQEIIETGLPRLGPSSITDPIEFRQDLQKVRQQGYSVCIDEMHEEVVSIAVPIRDYTGHVIAALSIVGPKKRMVDKNIYTITKELLKAGEEISINLGYLLND
ncbi:IclR family transcriptional regulator [Bacillus sp. Marseille-P3661]|uniref:IclR family transcriptional regulator n=1 Tax=Bacillus sp. Marseille-P3661 TaxID=1936234 RepID=UPI000C83BEA0|nr:IclR family transcriptional regulator [Bacillus sp. Marseille-P3661]